MADADSDSNLALCDVQASYLSSCLPCGGTQRQLPLVPVAGCEHASFLKH